jgi:WD40 repeat protein
MGCGDWYWPGKMTLFSFPSMQPAKVLTAFKGGVTSLAFSPDGNAIAAGSYDRRVYLFSNEGKELGSFLGHESFVSSVAFAADGRRVASSSWDNTVRIWDAGENLRNARRPPAGMSCAVLADGRIVTDSNPLSTIDRTTGAIQHAQQNFASESRSMAVSSDGRFIATGDARGHVMVWDSSTLARLHDFQDSDKAIWCVSFSPDGKTLASAGDNNKVTLREVQDGRVVRVVEPKGERARCLAFAPDGVHLATATWQGGSTVQVWDLRSGEPSLPLEGNGATCMKYSPDGKLLAAARQNLTTLYDAHTGRIIETFTSHSGDVWEVAFSPDGKTLGSVSGDRTVRLWSISNRQLLLTFALDSVGFGLAFSRDGRRLAATTSAAYVWDAADPAEADEHIDGVLHRINALRRAHQIADAEQFAARMLVQYRQRRGEHNAWTARLMVERASLLTQLGDASRYHEAETLLLNGRAELARKIVPGHKWRWRALNVARELYGANAMNDPSKLAEVQQAGSAAPNRGSISTAATTPTNTAAASLDQLNREAYILRRDGKLEQARELRARVVDSASKLYPRGDARLVRYQADYFRLLLQMQRYKEAEAVASDALDSLPSDDATSRLMMLRSLVGLYEQWDKPEDAERWRKLANAAEAATRPTTNQAR